MTGYSRDAIVHQGRLDPGVSLLQKPVTQALLASKIREILNKVLIAKDWRAVTSHIAAATNGDPPAASGRRIGLQKPHFEAVLVSMLTT
ncbi:hypothetical protein V1288_003712 [Bradyrhizobium sp. AZCC 2176]